MIMAELRLLVNFHVSTDVIAPRKTSIAGAFQPFIFRPSFTITDGRKE